MKKKVIFVSIIIFEVIFICLVIYFGRYIFSEMYYDYIKKNADIDLNLGKLNIYDPPTDGYGYHSRHIFINLSKKKAYHMGMDGAEYFDDNKKDYEHYYLKKVIKLDDNTIKKINEYITYSNNEIVSIDYIEIYKIIKIIYGDGYISL